MDASEALPSAGMLACNKLTCLSLVEALMLCPQPCNADPNLILDGLSSIRTISAANPQLVTIPTVKLGNPRW
jgi:hypothetical protein